MISAIMLVPVFGVLAWRYWGLLPGGYFILAGGLSSGLAWRIHRARMESGN